MDLLKQQYESREGEIRRVFSCLNEQLMRENLRLRKRVKELEAALRPDLSSLRRPLLLRLSSSSDSTKAEVKSSRRSSTTEASSVAEESLHHGQGGEIPNKCVDHEVDNEGIEVKYQSPPAPAVEEEGKKRSLRSRRGRKNSLGFQPQVPKIAESHPVDDDNKRQLRKREFRWRYFEPSLK